jgi:outer membrane lipoprotein SlyB
MRSSDFIAKLESISYSDQHKIFMATVKGSNCERRSVLEAAKKLQNPKVDRICKEFYGALMEVNFGKPKTIRPYTSRIGVQLDDDDQTATRGVKGQWDRIKGSQTQQVQQNGDSLKELIEASLPSTDSSLSIDEENSGIINQRNTKEPIAYVITITDKDAISGTDKCIVIIGSGLLSVSKSLASTECACIYDTSNKLTLEYLRANMSMSLKSFEIKNSYRDDDGLKSNNRRILGIAGKPLYSYEPANLAEHGKATAMGALPGLTVGAIVGAIGGTVVPGVGNVAGLAGGAITGGLIGGGTNAFQRGTGDFLNVSNPRSAFNANKIENSVIRSMLKFVGMIASDDRAEDKFYDNGNTFLQGADPNTALSKRVFTDLATYVIKHSSLLLNYSWTDILFSILGIVPMLGISGRAGATGIAKAVSKFADPIAKALTNTQFKNLIQPLIAKLSSSQVWASVLQNPKAIQILNKADATLKNANSAIAKKADQVQWDRGKSIANGVVVPNLVGSAVDPSNQGVSTEVVNAAAAKR